MTVSWVDCLPLVYYRGVVDATPFRRAALGDNPTQEEMDAVVTYGLEQHKMNFLIFTKSQLKRICQT